MKSFLSLGLLAALGAAQTPEGFEPIVEESLVVMFEDLVVTPGMALTKPETAALPTIGSTEPLDGNYLLMVIDITVPKSFTPGDYEPRRIFLHGMISGYTSAPEATEDGIFILSTEDDTMPATYMGPSPPAEDPPMPHQYVELLFETEEGWVGPDIDWSGFENRIPFDLEGFLEAAELDGPVAANYWEVTGEE